MVNIEKKKEKIIFTDSVSSILDRILKKYNLEKSEEEFVKALEQNTLDNFPDTIILDTIVEVAKGDISLEDLPSELKKRLDIKKDAAEKLAEDIKTELLVLTKKVPLEEKPAEEKEETPPRAELKEKLISHQQKEKEVSEENLPLSPKIPSSGKPLAKTEPEQKRTSSKKTDEKKETPDIYREPIE